MYLQSLRDKASLDSYKHLVNKMSNLILIHGTKLLLILQIDSRTVVIRYLFSYPYMWYLVSDAFQVVVEW